MIQKKMTDFTRFFHVASDLIKLFASLESHIKRRIFFSLNLVCITIFLNVMSPLLLKHIVEAFSVALPKGHNTLIILGFAYGFSWGMSQITMQLREILSFRVIERITRALTLKIFDKINSFSVNFFVERQLGETLNTINKAQEGIPYLFAGLFFYLIPTIIEIIIACIVLAIFLPIKFTVLFLTMLIVYVVFSLLALNKSNFYQEESINKSHKAYSYLVDRLLNYETIKIFCQQKFESAQLNLQLKEAEEANTNASVFMESIRLGQGVILGISLLFLILTAIWSFLNHEMRLDGFILVNAYFMQLSAPLNYFSLIIKDINKGFINLGQAYDILSQKSENHFSSEKTQIICPFAKIEFKNVSFGYHKEGSTLQNINFCLEKGRVISLVGKTGSGKSTIAKLLLRFYEPITGTISVDENNYVDFNLDFIRQNIGYVPQDPVLFCNTIKYNLTYGNSDISTNDIEAALEKANLTYFIASLPNGLNTIIGERGASLSGGEKQRIALARIFLNKKSLYIFDEATSALDSNTQQLIQTSIQSLKQHSSVLIISHRLTSIIDSDEILVLAEGKIIEKGNHSTLLALNNKYASFWKNTSPNNNNSRSQLLG